MSAPSTTSWVAPCCPPRSRGRAGAVLLAATLAAAGCGSQAAHQKRVGALRGEVARLDEESRANARSVEALERERDGLLAEIEGLRDARESLDAELKARDTKLRDMRVGYDALVKDLESDVAAGRLRIEQLTEGLSFRLPKDVLFPPGSAVLEPKGRRAVADI